ncbi:mCG140779, partial [Mus musculus]
ERGHRGGGRRKEEPKPHCLEKLQVLRHCIFPRSDR